MNRMIAPDNAVTFLHRCGGAGQLLLAGLGVTMIAVSVRWLPSLSSSTDVQAPILWQPLEFSPPLKLELPGLQMGTETTFAAVVKNSSDEALRVHQVSANCSCTDVQLDVTEIPAGGEAKLTGKLRVRPKEKKTSSIVTIGAVGVTTGWVSHAKYPVSAELIPTISLTSEFHDAEPIAGSDNHGVGHLTVKNTSDREVVVEVVPSNFEWKSVRVIPSKATLPPGASMSLSIEVDRMPERHGILTLTVDEGRETHTTPIRVLMSDSVRVSPATLVLGHVTATGSNVESSFPAHVSIHGKSLSENSVVLKKLPAVLHNPRLIRASDHEWTLDCDLNIFTENPRIQGVIGLEIVSPGQVVLQSIEIPIVGFMRQKAGGRQ